jgi:DNA-binding MarR family transcriptional regulator
MELEKVIQQKAFQNQHHKLVVNLIYTGNWITQKTAKDMKKYGITVQQYNILRILRGQYPQIVPFHVIEERMLDKSSNVTRILERMIKKGFVEVTENQKDRRRKNVIICSKGLDLLSVIDKKMPQATDILHLLTEEEATTLNILLDKLRGDEN